VSVGVVVKESETGVSSESCGEEKRALQDVQAKNNPKITHGRMKVRMEGFI